MSDKIPIITNQIFIRDGQHYTRCWTGHRITEEKPTHPSQIRKPMVSGLWTPGRDESIFARTGRSF